MAKTTMRAMVARKYGVPHKVLKMEEVPVPTPQQNELLVKIHAAGVNAIDWHLIRASPMFIRFSTGLFAPKDPIPGGELAGIVEAVGTGVTKFKKGDEVFGQAPMKEGRGAFAEFVCLSEENFVKKPSTLSFEEAACIPIAGLTAFQAVREDGKVQEGDKVLVTGASGGVGSFAVQICKAYNAHVTATCSTSKVEAVSEMGADRVIDYRKVDYTEEGIQYDVILDAGGFTHFKKVVKALQPKGTYVFLGGSISNFLRTKMFGSCYATKDMTRTDVDFHQTSEDLEELLALVVEGKVRVVLDKSFQLEQVGEAIRYMEERKVIGKIPITIA